MNIRIRYRLNPIHNGKHITRTIIKNGKIKKETIVIYKAFTYRPRMIIREDDIFA